MAANIAEPPLIVIVGPTASGKTALAVKIAKQYGGEVISADSRAVYRGMDIGTAKPSMEERQGVLHWGIDIVNPDERFTAADFKEYAVQKIDEIRSRGHVPILVGGTGLYIDCVVFDYIFPCVKATDEQRSHLETMSVEELQYYCHNNNISMPKNYKNKRHLINTIVRGGAMLQRKDFPISNSIIVGITTDRDTLRERIRKRVDDIFEAGVVKEAIDIGNQYGWHVESMSGIVYRIVEKITTGSITVEQARQQMVLSDWHLAKRQMTWFRRNKHVWWGTSSEVYNYCAQKLAQLNKT